MANSRKHKTKAEDKHLSRVVALGCMACQVIGYEDTPAEIHHLRAGRGTGQKKDHFRTIPLCPHHHRKGKNSFHEGRANFNKEFGGELKLFEMTNEQLGVTA